MSGEPRLRPSTITTMSTASISCTPTSTCSIRRRENGAHALIAGSSRRKRLGHLLGSARLSDAEAWQTYGRDAERTIEGPAGSGFLEDASCYHKALPPETGDRLMLQLRYQ